MVEVYVPNWADSNIGKVVAAIIVVAIIAASVIATFSLSVANAVAVSITIIIFASHCVIRKTSVVVCKCIAILTDVLHRRTHL